MICGVVTLNIFGSHYATRLLDTTNFCLLGLAWIFGHGCAILSIYLRSHKKDPLCYQSIVGGLFLAIGTYYFAGKYGVTGAILMQVAVHLLSLIGAVITTIHFTKGYRESP